MPTATIFSDSGADGYVQSANATYSTARSGGTLSTNPFGSGFIAVGQLLNPDFSCLEGFTRFDSSILGAGATVSAATMSLSGDTDASTTDFTVNARSFNFGSSTTTADWIDGAILSGNTLLATYATSGGVSAGTYAAFTSQAGLPAAINKTGFTSFVISSSRHEGGNQPSGDEYVIFRSAAQAGTTNDPKLVITYTAPSAPPVFHRPLRIWRRP